MFLPLIYLSCSFNIENKSFKCCGSKNVLLLIKRQENSIWKMNTYTLVVQEQFAGIYINGYLLKQEEEFYYLGRST